MGYYGMSGLNIGGSSSVLTRPFKIGMKNGIAVKIRLSYSDLANWIQSLTGGIKDLRDYINGEKPLLQRVGPKSYFDTSNKFEYQKKLWHIREKDGDTIENAYDGEKTTIPNF